MADKRLVKVQFTYEDVQGVRTVSTLQGDPEEWLKIVNGYAAFQQVRAGRADERLAQFTWKDEPAPPLSR